MAALSPDPAKRPTPEQFRKQLDDPPEQISDATVPVEVPDPTLPVRTQSMAGSHRRRRLLTVATCLVIAAAIAGAGTLWLTGASAPSASEQAALTCTADATPRPTHWNPAGVSVKTASGAAVTTIAHYKTTDSTRTAVADDQGRAFTEYNLGGATSRYQVQVDVTVTKDSQVGKCATSFTPR